MRNALTELRDSRAGGVSRSTSSSRSKNKGQPGDHEHTSTFVDSFAAGATSGAFASILTTPFDVGKTRQQVLEHSPKAASDAATGSLRPEQRSMPRFIHHIWKEEGLAGLFRGWAARTLKVAPACAIMISSYEVGKKMARRMNERKRVEG